MSEQYGNQSLPTTLLSPLASGDMAATVVDATGLPTSGPFRIIVGTDIANEIIIVGAITGTSLSSLTRHAEGTSAADWPAGTPVAHVLTAGSFEQGITDSMDAHEADSGAHPQYVLGSDVGVSGGIAQLDGSGKVPDAQIPAAITRDAEYQAADAAHEADATNVHGITNTASLETTTGAQTKADAAATTAEGYADTKDAAHVSAGDPHTGYRLESAPIGTSDFADDSVTLAKFQNLATDRLLGRDTTGTGDPEQLTVGGGVEFSGSGGIQRSALTGEATASAGSNATTVAASHSGSTHAAVQAAAEATAAADVLTHSVKHLPVFNVKDYGALGNNSHDDTSAIVAAIAAAVAAGGGIVYFPWGIYLVSSGGAVDSHMFTASSYVVFEGEGPGSILKVKNNAGDFFTMFDMAVTGYTSPNHHIVFRDLAFDSNPTGNTTGDIGGSGKHQVMIHLRSAHDVLIERCYFDPCSGVNTVSAAGIGYNHIIRNCTFRFVLGHTTSGTGEYDNSTLYLESDRHSVIGCIFTAALADQARGAIETHGGHSTIIGNETQGFETLCNVQAPDPNLPNSIPDHFGAGNNIVVAGNSATDAGLGIQLWPSVTVPQASNDFGLSNVTIAGNAINVNQKTRATQGRALSYFYGVGWIAGFTGASKNIVISNNTIRFESGDTSAIAIPNFTGGIALNSTGDLVGCSIVGNTILDSPALGIEGISGAGGGGFGVRWIRGLNISNNVIVDAGKNATTDNQYRYAILLWQQLQGVNVSHNVIVDTGASALNGNGALSVLPTSTGKDVQMFANVLSSISGTLAQQTNAYVTLSGTKYKSGAGITNLSDADFASTPGDGTIGVVRDTTTGIVRICARANSTWKTAEVA